MKKLSAILCSLLVVTMCLTPTAYADAPSWLGDLKDGASNLWDKAKDKGSEIVDTVKEEGPGWIETGKEKAGEVIDKAGEVISDAQQKVSDWNANQQEDFWDRTDQMINGGAPASTPAPAQPPAGTNENDTNVTETPAPVETSVPNVTPEYQQPPRQDFSGAVPEDVPPVYYEAPSGNSSATYEELNGTLFYNGQWYRETTGQADVAFRGRTFARTDEVLLNLDAPLDDVIVLDGNLIQLSRSDYSVQEVKSTQPEQRLTDGDLSSSIVIAIIMTVVLCGLGALTLIWQSKRRTKNQ